MRTCICLVLLVGLASAGFYPGDEKMKRLAAVVNDISQILHQKLCRLDFTCMFSPLSIHSAWTNMWLGTGGPTYDEIYNAFQLYRWTGGRDKPHEAYCNILHEYRSDSITNGNVTFANYMSVNSGNPVIPKFIDSTRSYYLGEVANHSISDPLGPEKKINDYVKNMTNGFITQVFNKTGTINSTTQIVYVSTLHLAARWKNPFDKTKTVKSTFYQTEFTSIRVDMMEDYREVKLKTIDDATIMQLPCLGDRYAVYFLLPDFFTALAEQEKRLTDPDYIDTLLLNGFVLTAVHLRLPKLRIESTFELNSVLKQMGVVKAFEAKANFGNFSITSGAFVTTNVHKVVFEVTENGTAAIPAAPFQPSGLGPFSTTPLTFDEPFLIFVRDKSKNLIICQGKFTGK